MASYADGVTIKVNDVAATITAAEQQADKSVIRYTLSAPVEAGDTVTWEYSAATGHIVAESGGAALEDVTAQEVTNNVSADPIGDALRADCAAYLTFDSDAVDQTGRGNDLANHGTIPFISGKVGNAADFEADYQTQYFDHAHNADLSYYNKETYIALWVYFETVSNGYIVNKWQDGGDEEYSIEIFEDNGNPGNFLLDISCGNNGYAVATTFGYVPTGQWIFIEAYISFLNNTYGIAVNNGAFDADSNFDGYDTTAPFVVGLHSGTYFDGKMDELGIYHPDNISTWLTQDKRDYLYNSGAGRALAPFRPAP